MKNILRIFKYDLKKIHKNRIIESFEMVFFQIGKQKSLDYLFFMDLKGEI